MRLSTTWRTIGTRAATAHAGLIAALLGALTAGSATMTAPHMAALSSSPAPAIQIPDTLSCPGAHDLIVDQEQINLTGTQTFERVCVINGGTLMLPGVLRAGSLYIDASSSVSASGLGGDENPYTCQWDGFSGATLHVVVREAIVAGSITANGGDPVPQSGTGSNALCTGLSDYRPGIDGSGGQGGHITLEALPLTVHGTISAAGGTGAPVTDYMCCISGSGGAGGTITLLNPQPPLATLKTHLSVAGGPAGTPGTNGKPGRHGSPGHLTLAALTPAQRATLPAAPPPLITLLGPPPVWRPLVSTAMFARQMRCGTADLVVRSGATRTLSGTRLTK
mgnify:CR=1 FL=1